MFIGILSLTICPLVCYRCDGHLPDVFFPRYLMAGDDYNYGYNSNQMKNFNENAQV